MTKYFMVFATSLALCTSAHALKSEEYESALDGWEKSYPIIAKVRKDDVFKGVSKGHLETFRDDQNATPLTILRATLKTSIKFYLSNNEESRYFNFIEGLDPVYRDAFSLEDMPCLLPTIGENIYKVHRVVNSTEEKTK